MKTIYEPRGAAREYAPLAANLYTGCPHGCTYCYVPGCRRLKREQFHSDVRPYPNILKRLEKDADAMAAAGDTRRVLFSFTSDPYQDFAPGCDVTRDALQIMVDRGLNFEVCTKGGTRAARDFDLLRQGGQLGVSLVWARDGYSLEAWPEETEHYRSNFEPFAATITDRFQSLKEANAAGIYTWLSVEPVISTKQALHIIAAYNQYPFPDEFRIGKINHCAELEKGVDWQEFVDRAYDELDGGRARWMFKHSLHPCLKGRPATGGPNA